MRIQLKKMLIVNFKGIKELEINFNHVTSIYGDNATGKTTIFDAFLWLFFGKNSDDKSSFGIKPLDENNQFLKGVETEVTAVFLLDDQEVEAKKTMRQKWVRRRGELEEKYDGDENIYSWNLVPKKESEFKALIKEVIDESLFRLITNPFYFNEQNWTVRRNTLVSMAGDIPNSEIFDSIVTMSNKQQFASLITALNAGKNLEDFKKQIAVAKKRINDEAESIPARIDEVKRGMPQPRNFNAIRENLESLKEQLRTIQDTMNDEVLLQATENKRRAEILKQHNQQVRDKQQKIFNIKTQMQNIEFAIKQKAKEASGSLDAEILSVTRQLTDKKLECDRYTSSISQLENQVKEKESQVEGYRNEYEKEDSRELKFNDEAFICPACKQALPQTDIAAKTDELTANFNKDKIANLNRIMKNANAVKADIEILNTRVTNGKGIIATLTCEIVDLQNNLEILQTEALKPKESPETVAQNLLSEDVEYQQLTSDLAETEAIELTEPVFPPQLKNEELEARRGVINNQVFQLQKELDEEQQITKGNDRVDELTRQQNKLAQELADLEGTEYAIMQFSKAKVDIIEQRINGKFKFVRFKMFNQQVNGGESETCETLVNSNGSYVLFSDANNAARINAGIDIINAFSQFYNRYAPIFIDNRESVIKLIDSKSQIVNLIVSEPDKKLKIV